MCHTSVKGLQHVVCVAHTDCKALVATRCPVLRETHPGRSQLQPNKGRMVWVPKVKAQAAFGLSWNCTTRSKHVTSLLHHHPVGPHPQSRIQINLYQILKVTSHSIVWQQRKWEWWTSTDGSDRTALSAFSAGGPCWAREHTYPKEYRDSLEGRALFLGSFLLNTTTFSWKMRWQSNWGTAVDTLDSIIIVHLIHRAWILTQHWFNSGDSYSWKHQTGDIILLSYLHLWKQRWHKDCIKFS